MILYTDEAHGQFLSERVGWEMSEKSKAQMGEGQWWCPSLPGLRLGEQGFIVWRSRSMDLGSMLNISLLILGK